MLDFAQYRHWLAKDAVDSCITFLEHKLFNPQEKRQEVKLTLKNLLLQSFLKSFRIYWVSLQDEGGTQVVPNTDVAVATTCCWT